MKLAVIGSRGIDEVALEQYLPREVTELVSGGAKGVDACAARYAREHGIALREFLPEYARFGRAAPLRRNEQIVAYADEVMAFWDGRSKGTAHVVALCRRLGKPITVIRL